MTGTAPLFWSLALLGVFIYCVVQAVRDFRAKRYAWAAAAALAAAVILCIPIKEHSITVDLPIR